MSLRNKPMLFVMGVDQSHIFCILACLWTWKQTNWLSSRLNRSQWLTRIKPLWMISLNASSASKCWKAKICGPDNNTSVFWMQIWLLLSKSWHFSICRQQYSSLWQYIESHKTWQEHAQVIFIHKMCIITIFTRKL